MFSPCSHRRVFCLSRFHKYSFSINVLLLEVEHLITSVGLSRIEKVNYLLLSYKLIEVDAEGSLKQLQNIYISLKSSSQYQVSIYCVKILHHCNQDDQTNLVIFICQF